MTTPTARPQCLDVRTVFTPKLDVAHPELHSAGPGENTYNTVTIQSRRYVGAGRFNNPWMPNAMLTIRIKFRVTEQPEDPLNPVSARAGVMPGDLSLCVAGTARSSGSPAMAAPVPSTGERYALVRCAIAVCPVLVVGIFGSVELTKLAFIEPFVLSTAQKVMCDVSSAPEATCYVDIRRYVAFAFEESLWRWTIRNSTTIDISLLVTTFQAVVSTQ